MRKFKTSYIDFFVHFFCNLLRFNKGSHPSQKKVQVTGHPSELNVSKDNATATIPSCN